MPSALANFYTTTRAARKVIVVDLGFLGDSVHLVPALWQLKCSYAQARLHVVSSTVGCEVLRLAPCVDRAWAVELDPRKRTVCQQWQVVRGLRRERFDVAFNFSGADRTVFFTALTGAHWRVGHPGGRWHFWNRWLIPLWAPRQPPAMPVFEQRRQVLAACGFSIAAARFDLRPPPDAVRRAESLVPPGAVHFSINASSPLKEWPLEHWIALARNLLVRRPGWRIVATGSAGGREQTRLRELASAVADARLLLLPGGLPIADLAAVLLGCRMHVGGDSGVLHLAAALGTPTLSLFREYADASAWMPSGPRHRVLSVPCRCVNQTDTACASGRAECLATITPERVATLVVGEQVRS